MGRMIRHGYMSKLVELECKQKPSYAKATEGEYFVLEIGSWAGGSTITFAEAIKKYNGGRGKVTAVDAWQSFHGDSHIEKSSHAIMEKALKKGTIFDLFSHNIKASGFSDIVEVKRGWSKDILPTLSKEYFDLIFVDGSHFYEDVLLDLKNSAFLLKDGGVICGDDLELQFNEVDQKALLDNKANDSFLDPKNNKAYHPGIALAVHEFFGGPPAGGVTAWKGFWAMRKANDGWQRISYQELDEGKVEVPRHLRN